MTKNRTIEIMWDDTRVFSPQNKTIELSRMKTVGQISTETNEYYIIENPITINISTGKKHPETPPTFYMIPKAMIVSVSEK